jgi:hypothetical protein
MADIPHLLKNLRSALITHKTFELSDEVVKKHNLPSNVVKLSHIVDVIEMQKDLLLQPSLKLKEKMINPGHFKKMSVCEAMKVFDHAVSKTMYLMVKGEGYPEEMKTTAWFVDLVATWFTLTNSRCGSMALREHNLNAYAAHMQDLDWTIEAIGTLKVAGIFNYSCETSFV